MRTHELVTKAHYDTIEEIEKKNHGALSTDTNIFSFAKKLLFSGKEIMQRRFTVEIKEDGQKANLAVEYLALGSFNDYKGSLDITREEFEYLKEIWR